MQRTICALLLATTVATCKLLEDTDAGNVASFRRDGNGNVTVAVGVFMNRYPSVVDGEFFPFELYDEKVAELEEGEFKGFAADVITGKHPFKGFSNPDAVEKAKARSPQDPYHFDGYYLKIMVVNDKIAAVPDSVYLTRGFFPHNFYCPEGQESVPIRGDDNALGNPQSDRALGSPDWAARAARTVTFCKTKEVNGAYAGRDMYYTRVSLFAQDAYHINELQDELREDQIFSNLESQYHETISARVRFRYQEDGKAFSEAATIVNLNYNVTPEGLEMLEELQQNSPFNPEAIITSTDKVQRYLHDNRKRAHDANWQVLLLAQRKWLAIRMILEDMGYQENESAQRLRIGILTSLEMADVRDMLPFAEKLADYSSAADYINALRRNPAATVKEQEARELYFGVTSKQHFNLTIYRTAIAATTQQWFTSRKLYNWVSSMHDLTSACTELCPAQERGKVLASISEMRERYAELTPGSPKALHEAWMTYVSAVNKIYPDPHKVDPNTGEKATAAFKKKYVVVGNALDYENSSEAYKNAYRQYARRYDLVFAEPHGLLMGTGTFLQQMGEKRKPDDVHIVSKQGQLQYDWKMHPHVQYNTVDIAISEMLDGIYLQAKALHKLARKIHQHQPNDSQQIKLTSDFADQYQILPIAKAMLIRPDYAQHMNEVFDKYTRFRPLRFFSTWVLGGITIAATIAGVAFSIPTLGASLAMPALPSIFFAAGAATGLLSSAAQFQYGRVVQQRAESALFADNLGTNFEEFHQARQEYLQAKRDLYINAGLTVFDAAEVVLIAYRVGRAATQIKAITEVLGESAKHTYSNAFKHLKYCSSPYCRKFIQSVPVLTKSGKADDIAPILQKLNSAKNIDEFKTLVKNMWIDNNSALFRKVIEVDFINDVVRSRFLPFANVRIPFAPPKLGGISAARRVQLAELLDAKAAERMSNDEVLEAFGALVYGRRYKKKLIVWDRSKKSEMNLLGKKLGLSDKELQELFVGKYKGKKNWQEGYNTELKTIIDNHTGKERTTKVREFFKDKLGGESMTIKEADNFIAFYNNEKRVTTLKADFKQMLGKIVVYKKEAISPPGVEGLVPGLRPSGVSRLPGIQNDVVEQVANNRKWKPIFAANPDLKKKLLGELNGNVRTGGDLHNMIDNLNDLIERAFIAYDKTKRTQ